MAYHRNLILFLLIAVLFGGAFPAIKAGLDFFPPLLFAASRYALSAILLLVFSMATTDRWLPQSLNDIEGLLAGGIFFIGGTGLLFIGQQFTTSGTSAIIYGLIPILTVALTWSFLPEERLTYRGILGVLVGLVGVAIVVNPDPGDLAGSIAVGEILILLAAASVALGTVLVRRSSPTMSVVALTGWAMAIGALIQLSISVIIGESASSVMLTPMALLLLGYLAVFASGIGFVVYFYLLEQFGPLEINLVTYLIPVVAVLIGWVALHESIELLTLFGFGIILVGFALIKQKELTAEFAALRGAGR